MEYVYRYLNKYQEVVYIGITNNLKRRIKEHTQDKLKNFHGSIQVFAVIHREDAELLETYLICKYRPYFNEAKKQKGDVSFLGEGLVFPWEEYHENQIDSLEPFQINEQIITKEVVTEVKKKVLKMTPEDIWMEEAENYKRFKNAIDYEKEIIERLKIIKETMAEVKTSNPKAYNLYLEDCEAHKEKLIILNDAFSEYMKGHIGEPPRNMESHYKKLLKVNERIDKIIEEAKSLDG